MRFQEKCRRNECHTEAGTYSLREHNFRLKLTPVRVFATTAILYGYLLLAIGYRLFSEPAPFPPPIAAIAAFLQDSPRVSIWRNPTVTLSEL